jgi:hypothetical protein
VPELADTGTLKLRSTPPKPSPQSLPVHTGLAPTSTLFSNLGPFISASDPQPASSLSLTGGLLGTSSSKTTKAIPKSSGLFRFPSPQITPASGSGPQLTTSTPNAAPSTSPSSSLFAPRTPKVTPAPFVSSGYFNAPTPGFSASSIQGNATSTGTTSQPAPQWSSGLPIPKAPLDDATAPPADEASAINWPKSEPGTTKKGTRALPPSTVGRPFSLFTDKEANSTYTNEYHTVSAVPAYYKFSVEVG